MERIEEEGRKEDIPCLARRPSLLASVSFREVSRTVPRNH